MKARVPAGCYLMIAALTGIVLAATPVFAGLPAISGSTQHRMLGIDDVLGMQHLDEAVLSPDGEWVAASVQRPASAHEVYGRTAYEIDPSRNDIWLISRRTGERRNISRGAVAAAGYWCAAWSPDGRRLAMLSTQPEHGEPSGGDNVRLYVWDRETSALVRMSDAPIMTQTRYGAGLYRLDFRGGADESTIAHKCGIAGDNAPFLWLDDHHMLAAMLPSGQVSGLIDEYNHAFGQEARDAQALHDGNVATVMAVGSGAERVPMNEAANSAILRTIDVTTRVAETIVTVPAYPFRGELSVSVSPNRHHLAVLATRAAFPPKAGQTFPSLNDDSWTIEKRLGFVDLVPGATMNWITPPPAGKAPLELYGWSSDSSKVALRARAGPFSKETPLFVASMKDRTMALVAPQSVGGRSAGSDETHEPEALWVDDRHLVARFSGEGATRREWWLLGTDGKRTNLTAALKQPSQAFRRSTDGGLVAVADDGLFSLKTGAHALVPIGRIAAGSSIAWPLDPGIGTSSLLIESDAANGARRILPIALNGTALGKGVTLPASAALVDADLPAGIVLSSDGTTDGLFLRETDLSNARASDRLSLDTDLASINWGQRMLIDYPGPGGARLKGAVILPPGYKPGLRYPTLVWVYDGYQVDGLDGDYFTNPRMPGIYNLQVYAARGYVVLVPSMPMPKESERNDVYAHVGDGVMPAIDRLVAMGIADPDRLGLFGQSYGGYSVYALVTQTDRFRAAVAIAGITDLTGFSDQFDATAHGYPGIENEKSANPTIADQVGRHVPPHADYAGYWRNSPLAYVDRVETPLLMIHGEHDVRGPISQAESFFSGLYAQGKTARLLRYGGETHSLAQSPANIRDAFTETVGWFDKYVKGHAGDISTSAR